MNGEKRTTSPWVYVAIGCGGLLVLGVVALAALGYGAFRFGKQRERPARSQVTKVCAWPRAAPHRRRATPVEVRPGQRWFGSTAAISGMGRLLNAWK